MTAGRLINHDEASRAYDYAEAVAAFPVVGKSVRHRMDTPNLDQFFTNGCVGFSGTQLLNCRAARWNRQRFNMFYRAQRNPFFKKRLQTTALLGYKEAIENYTGSTDYDQFGWTYPPDDKGSSALGLMRYWKQHRIIDGYRWAFTFPAFLAALQHQPVLVGTWWYEGFNTPDEDGYVDLSGEQVGGHEYLANAILWDHKLIGFENSWGESWGERGKFYMDFDTVELLLSDDGDVAIPVISTW